METNEENKTLSLDDSQLKKACGGIESECKYWFRKYDRVNTVDRDVYLKIDEDIDTNELSTTVQVLQVAKGSAKPDLGTRSTRTVQQLLNAYEKYGGNLSMYKEG